MGDPALLDDHAAAQIIFDGGNRPADSLVMSFVEAALPDHWDSINGNAVGGPILENIARVLCDVGMHPTMPICPRLLAVLVLIRPHMVAMMRESGFVGLYFKCQQA